MNKILLTAASALVIGNPQSFKSIKNSFYEMGSVKPDYMLFSVPNQKIDYSGIYKCSSGDMIRLNSDGTGKFIMSYISDEVVMVNWYVSGSSISLSPTDEIQKYSIFPQHVNIVNDNQGKISLSHRTVGPTFVYVKI